MSMEALGNLSGSQSIAITCNVHGVSQRPLKEFFELSRGTNIFLMFVTIRLRII